MPANMKAAGMKYKKGGSKRRKVTYSDNSSARAGKIGGTPTQTKTVTKKRGNKTITKTKTVGTPMNPFAKGTVSKSKKVTTGSGPTKQTIKSSGSNKRISSKRADRIAARMAKKTPPSAAPNRTRPAGPTPPKPNYKSMGMGGKAPMAKDYVGNPMKYFNDKAMYGKEKALKAMVGKETQTYP